MTPEEAFEKWRHNKNMSPYDHRVAMAKAAWLEATRQAYEESARICDGMTFKIEGIGDDELHYCISTECAKAIRSKVTELTEK